MISKEDALRIARKDTDDIHVKPEEYEIVSSLEEDGWHVDYNPKQFQKGGGGPSYLIDQKTGEIISKIFQR